MAKSRWIALPYALIKRKASFLDPRIEDDSGFLEVTPTLAAEASARSVSGTPKADRLTGTSGNDILSGLAGNDLLDGRKGRDRMTGGKGNDTYIVDNAGDQIIKRAKGGTDLVKASVHWTVGSQVENLTLTGRSGLKGTGNSLANTITGNDGHNILDGKAGADKLAGGKGNDTYIVDDARDRVTEKANQGLDAVQASVNYTLGAHVENLLLTGGALFGTGNDLDNRITGNALANILSGEAGNDGLDGGAGNDSLVGGSGADLLLGGDGSDTLEGGSETDTLDGGLGNDRLDGGSGADTLAGGTGDDTYFVDHAGDVVVEGAGGGIDTVWAEVNSTLGAHVERLVLRGSALAGTGNALANVIAGTAGNNTLDGGAGADTLEGSAGNDVYVVDDSSDVIVEDESGGTDTVRAALDYTLGERLEHLVLIGAAISGTGNNLDNAITGNALANSLSGANGHDTLDGGTGADTLEGGEGNDLYIVDHANDVIVETAEGGIDTVHASGNYVLGDNVERLTLIGAAVAGTGNGLANTIIGNALANSLVEGAGSDTLDGGEGADTLSGGNDDDTYLIGDANDVIVESADGGYDTVYVTTNYTIGDHVEHLVLVGSATAGTGNARDNKITGNTMLASSLSGADGDDTLEGGGGHDTLIGGIGRDSLVGGIGNDVYVMDGDAGDIIDEQDGDEDFDTIRTTFQNYSLAGHARIEALVLVNDTAPNVATGNGLDNDLTTGGNSDSLDGGAGNDTMRGGDGHDTYAVRDAGDRVIEGAGKGTDRVYAYVSYTLDDYVENLILAREGLTGTGNTLANLLEGTIWADTLIGGGGNDTLAGNSGPDRLEGGTGDDILIVESEADIVVESEGEGIDTVVAYMDSYTLGAHFENLTLMGPGRNGTGNGLDNILIGNAGQNSLTGGGGNDTLDGGGSFDDLDGGLGDDLYIIDSSDALIEVFDGGTDTVRASFTYTLRVNFENLELTGIHHIDGTGNELNNVIVGNSGNNILNGMGGTDTLIGGDGDDVYTIESAAEVIIDIWGTDTLRAGFNFGAYDQVQGTLTRTHLLPDDIENLILVGGTEIAVGVGNISNNHILGNNANNVLDGVFGNDTLNGGQGNDILFSSQGTTTFEFSSRFGSDRIRGFELNANNRIDLRSIKSVEPGATFSVGEIRDPNDTSVFIYRIEVFGSNWTGQIYLQDFNRSDIPQGKSIFDYILA